ncbi:MAG: HAD family hydrolase [Desulfobacterales bacterium]|nr:HAD family hydrolase [Desulfobacterales bacterium]MCF8078721.1 HAD family hydrolase [Desulfobacterales bacterium]
MNCPSFSFRDIQVVVFDCDGVLFDTRRANRAYYNSLLSHVGRPLLTEEQFTYVHMHTVDNALAYLFDDPEERKAAHEFRRQMGYQPFLPYMEMEPTLKPLLASLRPRWKTAVATNRTDTMKPLLDTFGLKDAFDLVVCSSDVPRPKPHPDMLLKVLDHFNVSAEQALYLGDSKVDEEAARAAGVALVAYGDQQLDAVCQIQKLSELDALLDGGTDSDAVQKS